MFDLAPPGGHLQYFYPHLFQCALQKLARQQFFSMGYENLDPAILAGEWHAFVSSFAAKQRRRDENIR